MLCDANETYLSTTIHLQRLNTWLNNSMTLDKLNMRGFLLSEAWFGGGGTLGGVVIVHCTFRIMYIHNRLPIIYVHENPNSYASLVVLFVTKLLML